MGHELMIETSMLAEVTIRDIRGQVHRFDYVVLIRERPHVSLLTLPVTLA